MGKKNLFKDRRNLDGRITWYWVIFLIRTERGMKCLETFLDSRQLARLICLAVEGESNVVGAGNSLWHRGRNTQPP